MGPGVLGDHERRLRQPAVEECGVEFHIDRGDAGREQGLAHRGVVAVAVADLDQPVVDQHRRAHAEAGLLEHDPHAHRGILQPSPQQGQRLDHRQADDVGVGAVDRRHEGRGPALDGVAAGLALPLAAGEVASISPSVSRLNSTMVVTRRAARRPSGASTADRAMNPVAAAGQQGQAAARLRLGLGLGQDAAAAGHHGIGRQHEAGLGPAWPRPRQRLGARQPRAHGAAARPSGRRLVDVGGLDRSGWMPTCRSRSRRRGEDEARISVAAVRQVT